MDLVEKILVKETCPNAPGWYDTNEGNIYWWASKETWSCRSDRISEEYPEWWLNPVASENSLNIQRVMLRYKCINCGNTCLLDHRPSNNECGGCDSPNWKILKFQKAYKVGMQDYDFPHGEA